MAHKKRYKKLSRQLCEQAVVECFKGKWRRNDVLTFIEKYAGIPRDDIKIDDLSISQSYELLNDLQKKLKDFKIN